MASVNMTKAKLRGTFMSLKNGSHALQQAADILTNDNSSVASLFYGAGQVSQGGRSGLISVFMSRGHHSA